MIMAVAVMCQLCVQVSLDKLYMSAANHVFEKKMKPLLLEQRKKGHGHFYNKETLKVAKTMMTYIHCIQSAEWAAATAHRITQELPPGQIVPSDSSAIPILCLCARTEVFLCPAGYEKTQSLRFCLALGDAWLKDPNLEVSVGHRQISIPRISFWFFMADPCV